MNGEATPLTDYEDAALWVLANEFDFSDKSDTGNKIKQKLLEKKLGPYDESRISSLRLFENAIQKEIHRWGKSRYFTHSHGKYADSEDFDRSRMSEDYVKQFPSIPQSTISRFVEYAVYLYYLR